MILTKHLLAALAGALTMSSTYAEEKTPGFNQKFRDAKSGSVAQKSELFLLNN